MSVKSEHLEHEDHEFRKRLLDELREVVHELRKIARILGHVSNPVNSFVITGDSMNINAGQNTLLTAVPLDVNGQPTVLPAGDVPTWSVDQVGDVDVSPSADGLSLNVTVHANTPPGDVINFQVTDAQVPSAIGTFQLTVGPGVGGQNPVASFSVTGSAPQVRRR